MSEPLIITVMVHARVQGPSGLRLPVGKIVQLEDCPYVRLLIKSGNVELIDPPSLDPEYLEASGFLFPKEVEKEVAPNKVAAKDLFSAVPKKKTSGEG